MPDYTSDEIMTVAAARLLDNSSVCFVGIGFNEKKSNYFAHCPYF